MNYYPDFAEILNQKLAEYDRSASWLANRLDVNASTVRRWLKEGTRPGASEVVVKIADLLRIEKRILLNATGYGYQEIAATENTPSIHVNATGYGYQEIAATEDTPSIHVPSIHVEISNRGSSEFAEMLDRALARNDRTVSWLANRLDVSASTVSRWLNHDTRPSSPERVVQIADILEIDKAELLPAAGYGYQETAATENIHSISAEIAERGRGNVLTYLRSLAAGESPRYEAKLILVGEGGTGKSSILRSLLNLPFEDNLPSTHGIEIQQYQFPHPDLQETNITLNVWDFGGQQIYHTTHQFFMTQRSLYLLVWNARGDTDQARLDHWLRHIEVLAPDAPIILVATHIDERLVNFNYARFAQAYPRLVGWVGVSNKTGTGIDGLKKLIAHEAARLPLMGQRSPKNWIDVEIQLHQDQNLYISSKEFKTVCTANGVSQLDEQTVLGAYLHDLGTILYYQDDNTLSDFIVLKPNWLTQAMANVLDDKVTRDENSGILYHNDFSRIWPETDKKMQYERRLYPLFYRFLERFLICYKLEEQAPKNVRSLVPLLLPHSAPEELEDWVEILPLQRQLQMLYKLDFVPPGIMSWLIVLTHHFSQDIHWHEGVRLCYRDHQAEIVLNPSLRELWLRVKGPQPSNFFNILQFTINDRVIQRYFTGLKYERQIPCHCHLKRDSREFCFHFFDYDKLSMRLRHAKFEVECEQSYEMMPVLELLEAIHHDTQDKVIDRLDELLASQQQIESYLIELVHLIEQVLRHTTRTWHFTTNNLSSEAPCTFIVMPGSRSKFSPKNIFNEDLTLHLLCQHPAGPHLITGEQGYPIPRNREWWDSMAPWLRELVKYLKYVPQISGVAEAYLFQLNLDIFTSVIDLIPDLSEDEIHAETNAMVQRRNSRKVQGAALRQLRAFLEQADPSRHWCGLNKVATNDGDILWLCDEHAQYHGI